MSISIIRFIISHLHAEFLKVILNLRIESIMFINTPSISITMNIHKSNKFLYFKLNLSFYNFGKIQTYLVYHVYLS